ncbi:MAG: ABC transporter ATP-binding protein [Chloroflexi bacterium]|nr:ABC transporter ATP-binding protein [Chloroflexota bacterium]
MSTIRLVDVTKTYSRSALPDRIARANSVHSQADRAFAERALAHTVEEQSQRSQGAGPIVALDHVNLTIPDGHTFAILGPSGCGKSTLLRVVAGLIQDYQGHVYYDDQAMEEIPPKDRYIGMVFQNYALYPHFESKGNLDFFFRIRRAPDEEAEERIRITSEMMGIGFKELLGRKPGTLSGGQQQRVAIARAIVRNPRLFLFDEPLSNLDAKLRTQTRVEIKRLLHRFGITSIYVTHDQTEAISLGDQIAVMREGKIEQVGPYQELREKPVNAFVAGFLGYPPMNLLPGGTVEDGELRLGDIGVPLPASVRERVREGQSLTLGIRPEEMKLILGRGIESDGVRMRGAVEVVEPDFARQSQLAYVRTGSMTYSATGALDVTTMINTGDVVDVVFPPEKCYFFDGESGLRVA